MIINKQIDMFDSIEYWSEEELHSKGANMEEYTLYEVRVTKKDECIIMYTKD